jgi:hypothetical protein
MNYTDYHLVQEVYMKNHEIASHTLFHVPDPGAQGGATGVPVGCIAEHRKLAVLVLLSCKGSSGTECQHTGTCLLLVTWLQTCSKSWA